MISATFTQLTVTNLDDSGPGSLRQALAYAPPNTLITFDPSLNDGTITLDGEQLVIDKHLTIDATSLPSGLTIDANRISRVLKIEPETTVALHGLTLTVGSAENGGGIHNERATLALSNCVITGNHSEVLGGGIYNDADEPGTAALTITHCTLTENTTSNHGAAIHNGGNPGELFVFDGISGSASLTLTSCLLEDNKQAEPQAWTATGGVISSFGGISDDSRGRVHLTDSTFAANSCSSNLNVVYSDLTLDTCTIANNLSGGIFAEHTNLRMDTCIIDNNSGAGIHSLDSSLDLNTCIISKSSVHGIRLERSILHLDSCSISNNVGNGIYSRESNLDLETSTISNNSAEYGGGIRSSHSNITLDRCTISENTVTTFVNGCGGWTAGCTREGGLGGGIYGWATSLSLKACTITGNLAKNIIPDKPWPPEFNEHTAKGGGVYLVGSEADTSALTLEESIIAGNTAVEASNFFLGAHTSTTLLGNQLISDLTGSSLSDDPSILVADPRLAPLGDYGGPTMTMPPMPSSPAIDAAALPRTTHQRGFPIVGQRDLGAVEYQGDADLARVFHVDYDKDGNSLGIESALGTDPFTADQNHPNNLGAPVFNGAAQPVLTFGLGENAHPDTTWILERSTDLVAFEEIYAFDGTTDFAIDGIPIEVERTEERITITDKAPPTEGAFYRFRAKLTA